MWSPGGKVHIRVPTFVFKAKERKFCDIKVNKLINVDRNKILKHKGKQVAKSFLVLSFKMAMAIVDYLFYELPRN